jgi:hypothetical protein
MARKSDASNRIGFKEAAPVLGAVGALSLAGGASAATTGPAMDAQSLDTTQRHQIAIAEEELTDVSLATFYVFDKENAKTPKLQGEQVAWWYYRRCWRCWGCRRCWGCGCRC